MSWLGEKSKALFIYMKRRGVGRKGLRVVRAETAS